MPGLGAGLTWGRSQKAGGGTELWAGPVDRAGWGGVGRGRGRQGAGSTGPSTWGWDRAWGRGRAGWSAGPGTGYQVRRGAVLGLGSARRRPSGFGAGKPQDCPEARTAGQVWPLSRRPAWCPAEQFPRQGVSYWERVGVSLWKTTVLGRHRGPSVLEGHRTLEGMGWKLNLRSWDLGQQVSGSCAGPLCSPGLHDPRRVRLCGGGVGVPCRNLSPVRGALLPCPSLPPLPSPAPAPLPQE